jgi:hypothetical protein
MTRWTSFFPALALSTGLVGCTSFSQVYHFQSQPSAPGSAPNYFRVRVTGDAQTAKTRYVAGFYDERAVDLYFNETRSGNGEIRPIFVDSQKLPGEQGNVKPLTPDNAKGTFVMIFSTNPKAVADTIGAFAESQAVTEAFTNIVNRRDVEAARLVSAGQPSADLAAAAVNTELASLIPVASDTPAATAPLKRTYLRTLEAIARQTGGPSSFADFAAARAWLAVAK